MFIPPTKKIVIPPTTAVTRVIHNLRVVHRHRRWLGLGRSRPLLLVHPQVPTLVLPVMPPCVFVCVSVHPVVQPLVRARMSPRLCRSPFVGFHGQYNAARGCGVAILVRDPR